ncbi:HutD family protein [Proteiniborus sp.]|uniref:HutD family protein n=1 Tax=Proteiniborus sp. TaxID=2079015 RepID=UPI00331E3E0F
MANTIKLIKNEDFIVTEWSGGKTTQIYIYPEDASYKSINFKFRISSATVELEKSEFTKLEGVYRFITPLDKNLKLTHNNEDYMELKPFQIYEFDGGLNTTSYGTAKDFNLMLANGTKGSLSCIYIDEEYVLNEILSKNQFTIILSVNDVNIETHDNTYSLKAMEALIINSSDDTPVIIKIVPTKPSNILVARVYIDYLF